MKAIIFAAGLGTRLQPFTQSHPKALVEVNGKPMLQRVIERLRDASVTDIVVNVHHFARQIIDFLKANNNFGCNIMISDEQHLLLDTGGGIAKAASMLDGAEPFIAYNADILTDFDIMAMIESHKDCNADVTLLTSHRNSSRQLYFDSSSRLRGWQNLKTGETRPVDFIPDGNVTPLSFNGVHIIEPHILPLLLEYAKSKPVFSITPFYIENADRIDIRSFTPTEKYQWYDIGRNETLEKARNEFKS